MATSAVNPVQPDDIASLLYVSDILREDAAYENSLAMAEKLQLEEAMRLSLGLDEFDSVPADIENDFEYRRLMLEMEADTMEQLAQLTAMQFWAADVDEKELKDHELALRMQKVDEDGYDLDVELNILNLNAVDVDVPTLETFLSAASLVKLDASGSTDASSVKNDAGKTKTSNESSQKKSKGKQVAAESVVDDDDDFDLPPGFTSMDLGPGNRNCGICFDKFNLHPLTAASSSLTAASAGMYFSCGHGYCYTCITEHVRAKISAPGSAFPPTCPSMECDVTIEKRHIHKFMTDKDEEIWYRRSRESQIRVKVYCPNKRCSALHDGQALQVDQHGASRCWSCSTRFCKTCRCHFHDGITCAQYQALPESEREIEDRQAIQLAESKAWRRCPSCRVIVELNYGCNHITCLCGHHFCYKCGSNWEQSTQRCISNQCELWDENMLLAYRERMAAYQQAEAAQVFPAAARYIPPERRLLQNLVNAAQNAQNQARNAPPRYYDSDDDYDGPLNRGFDFDEIQRNMSSSGARKEFSKPLPRWYTNMLQSRLCTYCDVRFYSEEALYRHLNSTEEHNVPACCGRLFRNEEDMWKHQQSSRFCRGG